jgi:hypothetical protein
MPRNSSVDLDRIAECDRLIGEYVTYLGAFGSLHGQTFQVAHRIEDRVVLAQDGVVVLSQVPLHVITPTA